LQNRQTLAKAFCSNYMKNDHGTSTKDMSTSYTSASLYSNLNPNPHVII
jgi:hypothetical protein